MNNPINQRKELGPIRDKIHEIIFEADTPAGKFFDILLIINIIVSVIVVMLDSVREIQQDYGELLYAMEWFFTILFSIEYLLRLFCIGRPIRYATGFFGVVDLLAILPTYISLFFPGTQYLMVIRILRMLRVFRVLKLAQYVSESNRLAEALQSSRRKIEVFLFAVVTSSVILGSMMFIIEGEKNGFTSIPRSIYWAIVTMTTVGYGDISPQTNLGQVLAAIAMILGYSIIAVPTGIITAELTNFQKKDINTRSCTECSAEGHDNDAVYCNQCGTKL